MKNTFLLFIIGLIFLNSCKDNIVNNIEPSFTKNSFPVKVGNWWKYQIIDSLSHNSIDTITIRIDSLIEFNGIKKYVSHIERGYSSVDSCSFSLSDSIISFIENNIEFFGIFEFNLPFSVANKWYINVPTTDSTKLIDTSSVISFDTNFSVLGHNYKNVFFINSECNNSFVSILQTYQVAENIGIFSHTFMLICKHYFQIKQIFFNLHDKTSEG